MCRWGFSNIVKSLKAVTDDRIRAYIVWLPILGGDFNGEARKLSISFPDKRVIYYLDPKSQTGLQWERVLKTERLLAWDVYLLYGPDAQWNEEPEQPAFWMHQLGGLTKAPVLNEATFTARLKGMLDEMKGPPITKKPNQKVKIEFLYFKSCPGYTQALVNLKAALKESGVNAELQIINVNSETQAAKVGFQRSPSIRVNGRDIDGRNEGYAYGCRVYHIDGKFTPTPTKEFIEKQLRELM